MKRIQASYTYMLEFAVPDDVTEEEIEEMLDRVAPSEEWVYDDLKWTVAEG
jgi:hypothetical protein